VSRDGAFVLVTCEHAGHEVPPAYRGLFRGRAATAALRSHRGWDPGALGVAVRLAERLAAPLVLTTVTRLLVEPNRSPDHPELFSEFARQLPAADRDAITARHYRPHRAAVEAALAAAIDAGITAVHVGVHTFVDEWNGRRREVDIGLLFDPARSLEATISAAWQRALAAPAHGLRARHNEPYRGVDDGLTTALRGRFAADRYAGLEVEIRQGLIARRADQRTIADRLAETLSSSLPCHA